MGATQRNTKGAFDFESELDAYCAYFPNSMECIGH